MGFISSVKIGLISLNFLTEGRELSSELLLLLEESSLEDDSFILTLFYYLP
jgi:hypothetical protein